MKKVNLAYGKTGLSIEVPEAAVVIEPRHLPALIDDKAAILNAMRNPFAASPLRSMVGSSDAVAIVISDITRPTPNHKLVPWILEELSHIPRENFFIVNGVGSHRANTEAELIGMLGREVVESIRIVNHDAFNDSELVHVGRNSYGSEVYLNKTYMDAAFKIVTGFIEPHFFAGFSGGPKGINPAVAGIKTILDFHNAEMIGHPLSTWGILEGNILQDAAVQNCMMGKPDFMLNVTLNGEKQITGVFAGDIIAAHREGCRYVKETAMYGVEEAFDIVVTTNSGYPLDQNLYQTVKGMSAAAQIVRTGGAIISVSECCDGLPDHGNYAKILKMRETPEQLLEMICDPEFCLFDQWQVQVQAMIQKKADCYLFSALPPEVVENAKFIPINSVEATLKKLVDRIGPKARIAILPQGPLTIPFIREK